MKATIFGLHGPMFFFCFDTRQTFEKHCGNVVNIVGYMGQEL
jgi:hypothetical protein